jgi:hypothetical protein
VRFGSTVGPIAGALAVALLCVPDCHRGHDGTPVRSEGDGPSANVRLLPNFPGVHLAEQKIKGALRARSLAYDLTGVIVNPDRSLIRLGSLTGQPTSEVIIAQVGNAIVGTVAGGPCNSQCSLFVPAPLQKLRLVDPDKNVFGADAVTDLRNQGFFGTKKHELCAKESGDELTIYVAFTLGAKQAAGGEDAIQALILYAEYATRRSFANAGLQQTVRIVGRKQLDVLESPDLFDTLKDFQSKGAAERVAFGADLAILIVGYGQDCGWAGAFSEDYATLDQNAYAVTRAHCITCGYTFVHELGHLIGACHERDDGLPGRCSADGAGSHYAHRNHAIGRQWGTVMATGAYPRVLRWSADALCPGSQDKLGTPTESNAGWLTKYGPLIARLQCTVEQP